MGQTVLDILNLYNPANPLEKASTIPAPWYRDQRIEELERCSVLGATFVDSKSPVAAGRLPM